MSFSEGVKRIFFNIRSVVGKNFATPGTAIGDRRLGALPAVGNTGKIDLETR